MIPREPRRKVMIKARMRIGTAWRDACILDLSSRGLMIQSSEALAERTYLELRRGRHVIVARVMWSRDRRCGLRTQDPICAEAILAEPDRSAGPPIAPRQERREAGACRIPTSKAHEQSRWRARTIEFASVALACAGGAVVGLQLISEGLAKPLARIEQVLGKS